MQRKKGKKKMNYTKRTVTFSPDKDVSAQLAEVQKRGYGVRSRVINQAIREQLPKVLKRWDGFSQQSEGADTR